METKKLELTASMLNYRDKQTGEPKSFMVFQTNVNGIVLTLKASDRTTQAVLENYFSSAK